MNDGPRNGFAERLSDASAAKQALLAKLRPRPTQIDPLHATRAAMRAEEQAATRARHLAVKTERRQAAEAAELQAREAALALEAAALQQKRGERKERKILSAAEAKAKRDAKYAARQARR